MYLLQPDIFITRKLRLHFLTDTNDGVVLQAANLIECLNHLYDADERSFLVCHEDTVYELRIVRRLPPRTTIRSIPNG